MLDDDGLLGFVLRLLVLFPIVLFWLSLIAQLLGIE